MPEEGLLPFFATKESLNKLFDEIAPNSKTAREVTRAFLKLGWRQGDGAPLSSSNSLTFSTRREEEINNNKG